jgi:hypothetical protein
MNRFPKTPAVELGVPRVADRGYEVLLNVIYDRRGREAVIEILLSPGEGEECRISDPYRVIIQVSVPRVEHCEVGLSLVGVLP